MEAFDMDKKIKIRATKPGEWLNDIFPRKMTDRQLKDCFNIWWRVALMHIPPRDPRFDFDRDWGMPKIEAVLEHKLLKMDTMVETGGQQIMFVFPERWMTTQEEYFFSSMLKSHPQIRDAKLTIIDIVTKSPLIIGDRIKEDIRIVKPTDDPDGMGVSKASREARDNTRL